jgi:hypothetical protein
MDTNLVVHLQPIAKKGQGIFTLHNQESAFGAHETGCTHITKQPDASVRIILVFNIICPPQIRV